MHLNNLSLKINDKWGKMNFNMQQLKLTEKKLKLNSKKLPVLKKQTWNLDGKANPRK